MSLCTCAHRPRCEFRACQEYADWSMRIPRWGERPEDFIFACNWHYKSYMEAMTKPMAGLDPIGGKASEDWRPSLIDMVNLSCLRMRHQEAKKNAANLSETSFELTEYDRRRLARMDAGQVRTIMRYRALCRLSGN